MGQKVNPIGLRLGHIRGWDSNWFASKKDFSDKLMEDEKIRKYLEARMAKGGISRIVIERTIKRITLTIHTARPGVIIGKGGTEVDKIREELKKLTNKEVQINIFEIKRPELDAKLVAESVVQQLKARISYRRAMKQAVVATMRVAEGARREEYKEGRIPLHTLRAEIDYASVGAKTIYGIIGVKVWIFKGEVYGKRDLSPNADLEAPEPSRPEKSFVRKARNAF
jgi:small subunit ribosomal protein S3